MEWTGMGCDCCGFGTIENIDEFDPCKPCPECGSVMVEKAPEKCPGCGGPVSYVEENRTEGKVLRPRCIEPKGTGCA